MNAFGIGGTKGGESKIVLLDMPGYGKASREEWGTEIMKYLKERKQYGTAICIPTQNARLVLMYTNSIYLDFDELSS